MVGIVVVSHSARLAAGVVELAAEMGGPDVRLEAAGGLGEDEGLGTDAMLVLAAIERADAGDGVLVLMDLGSAVLSAETALDLLDDARRGSVRLVAAPLVEGAVAAAAAAAGGATLDEAAAEARGALAPKEAQLGEAATPVSPSEEHADWETARFPVRLPHGLHARPAARLVRAAARFDATVEAARGDGAPVSARSLNALATLGVRRGDELAVRARGPQAREALDAVRALAERDFDEQTTQVEAAAAAAPSAARTRGELVGLPGGPGLAAGPARHARRRPLELPQVAAGPPAQERQDLERALGRVRDELEGERASVAARAGEAAADILDVHLLLLEDETLVEAARRAVDAGAPAARAWLDAAEAVAREYRLLEDTVQQGRAADVLDVGRRVAAELVGGGGGIEPPASPGVLVADDLAPGETARLDRDVVAAIATAHGGPTSHSAILARALGVPAVVGLGDAILEVPEGTELIVDGEAGRVTVEPDAATLREHARRRDERERSEREALAAAHEPAVTRDGARVHVLANVGTPADVELAVANGAEGVGLLRSEFLFLDRDELPGEQAQAEVLEAIAARLGGRPLTLRTLDVGGDKPLRALPLPREENPFLGRRGIRLTLSRPELLDTQLAAAVRVAQRHPVRVMLPMVSTPSELRAARERLRALAPDASLPLGAMIEVPAAALAVERLEADFLSLGTNDLAQYTMAADRDNDAVAALADTLEPAVLALVARTVERAGERPVAVCGEAAGDRLAVPVLIGLGIRELSVAPRAVPRVKQLVRSLDAESARALAAEALQLDDAAAVRAHVAGRLSAS